MKNSQRFLLLRFFSLLFLTSCASVPLKENSEDFQKKTVQKKINTSCFEQESGNFLTDVSLPNAPTFSWEGRWSNKFETLNTRILDPMGRVLYTLSVNQNQVVTDSFITSRNSKIQNADVKIAPLLNVLSKLGSVGLRSVLCGQTAFSPTLKLDGHNIHVKSTIDINPTKDTTIQILETKSEFYYGLFAKKNTNTLFWRGRIHDEIVVPQFIRFGAGKNFVMFNFLDYE